MSALSPHFDSNQRARSVRGDGVSSRFASKPWENHRRRWAPKPNHPALHEGRTIFRASVVSAEDAPRLLVSGVNQRKIGGRIAKGPWRGLPIYCLTLEERATCPRSCHHWRTCYGNNMPLARRHVHGPALERRLIEEVAAKAKQHRRGFAVRLHVLGDFYSPAYVAIWSALLDANPGLHVFGFTAWPETSEIGFLIGCLNRAYAGRAHIRFSSADAAPNRAITIARPDLKPADAIICPVQTGGTAACATCALCWSESARGKAIAFLSHG